MYVIVDTRMIPDVFVLAEYTLAETKYECFKTFKSDCEIQETTVAREYMRYLNRCNFKHSESLYKEYIEHLMAHNIDIESTEQLYSVVYKEGLEAVKVYLQASDLDRVNWQKVLDLVGKNRWKIVNIGDVKADLSKYWYSIHFSKKIGLFF